MDHQWLVFINQTIASPLLDGLMLGVTYVGLALCPALGVALLPRWRRLGLAVLAAIAASLFLTLAFQYASLRPRPAGVRLIWPAPNFPAFPSGHAAVAVATAVVMSLGARRRAVTFGALAAAALVSASRVYLGFHYPSDVLAGAVLGAGAGAACYGLLLVRANGSQRWRWLLWLQVALIIVISLMAYLGLLPRAGLTEPGVDKVLHSLLFGAITFWLNLWLAPRGRLRHSLPVAILVPFGLATLEEALQSLSPLRTADFGDLAADLAGMIVFWWISEQVRQEEREEKKKKKERDGGSEALSWCPSVQPPE